jgi:hypothetical protein
MAPMKPTLDASKLAHRAAAGTAGHQWVLEEQAPDGSADLVAHRTRHPGRVVAHDRAARSESSHTGIVPGD